MRRSWNITCAVALVAVAPTVIAGCSSAAPGATGTTRAPGSTTTTSAPTGLPATGSVDGFTLSVTMSPATGKVGHTSIVLRAVLKGAVKPATLEFQVSDRAAGDVGRPATDQHVSVTRPGTYNIPHPFSPTGPGTWASSVTFVPKQAGASKLTISGLPPVTGVPSPFPQLLTVVTST